MKTRDIKKKFLKSFESNGHIIYPSSPTIPFADPTLLFVNAGMNQFKDYFLGEKIPSNKRVATAQKCIRAGGKHNDLDNVGHTSRHLTFFEMLGNFSFGDYFKKEAIAMAFDLTTNVFGIDIKKVFVSVYKEDLEAFEIWKSFIKESQIVFMGEKDNFWSMGDTGPCGPCSELYFDRGAEFGNYKSPDEDPNGHRFIEFWNLVFMQFNKDKTGKQTPLPSPCIDTGLGLERMAALLLGKQSVFETDIFTAIIDKTSSIAKVPYLENKAAFHVIADHLRSLSFAIADGAIPSNVERGYVLRKILRRAVRYGRQISLNKPFLAKLLPTLIEEMGEDYPELKKSSSKIEELLSIEEESFHKTLSRGGNILQSIIEKSKETELKEISGKDAFILKDTFGFPIEEICLLAKDHHLEVNLETYGILEEEAKEKSKKAHKSHSQEVNKEEFAQFVKKHGGSTFLREQLTCKGSISGIYHNGEFVNILKEGEKGSIILDKTPFYAEMGGQRGDLGTICHHGATFLVEDCTSPFPQVFLHSGRLIKGDFIQGEPVDASIETSTRIHTEKNHTATHMLHYALDKVLGDHIKQAGSYVCENGLRLDFTHHKKVTREEIKKIEKIINDEIFAGHDVTIKEMSYKDIQGQKDVKQLFGEKYGETVRVVSVGDFSKELCGGTHIKNTKEIGLFKIIKEMSVSAGIRRIEAVTSKEALAFTQEKEDLLFDLCEKMETTEPKAKETLHNLLEEHKQVKQSLKKFQKEKLNNLINATLKEKISKEDCSLIFKKLSLPKEEFLHLATDLMAVLPNGMIVLLNEFENDGSLLIQKSKNATSLPSAKFLLDKALLTLDGNGGGSEMRAQGSFKNLAKMDEALKQIMVLF
jgi:alanyl-tRNA synthetase